MKSNPRVFLGLENIAGIFTSLKKGFSALGVKADFYSINEHIFKYETDKVIKYSSNPLFRKFQKTFLMIKMILFYDYFIFDSDGSLLPDFKDVKIFRFFGKKSIIVFVGCDVRMPEQVAKFKWNCCKDCTDEYKRHVGCNLIKKPKRIRQIESSFDLIACPEEASGSLSKPYHKILFPVDAARFSIVEAKPVNKRITILHAPSNEWYKGTRYVTAAIDELKKKYDFDFRIVRNISIEELYEEVRNADVIIDQMLVGFYGVLSLEAMAMGKPVICYIRPDIWEEIKIECPVINANPDDLKAVLENIINNSECLQEIGMKSRKYIKKFHEASVIANKFLEIYHNN